LVDPATLEIYSAEVVPPHFSNDCQGDLIGKWTEAGPAIDGGAEPPLEVVQRTYMGEVYLVDSAAGLLANLFALFHPGQETFTMLKASSSENGQTTNPSSFLQRLSLKKRQKKKSPKKTNTEKTPNRRIPTSRWMKSATTDK
jgi:hypothetical protein